MDVNNELHNGKIIFYKVSFGFIELPSGDTFYFRNKSLLKSGAPKEVKLLDHVTCKTGITKAGPHKGKPYAYDISFIKRGEFSEYKRWICRLEDWKGRRGKVESARLGIVADFYDSRLEEMDAKDLKEGDILITHLRKSDREENMLFAIFAYPLAKEKGLDFLQIKYSETLYPEVFNHLVPILFNTKNKTPDEQFAFGLDTIGKIDSTAKLQTLKSFIQKFKLKYETPVTWKMLQNHVPENFLILLWESKIIKSYDLEVVKRYFFQAKAGKKRTLIKELKNHQEEILNQYHEHILQSGKLKKINNELKTFLSILSLVESYPNLPLYKNVKENLKQSLNADELIQLWVYDYLDELPDNFIRENFDLSDISLVKVLLNSDEKKAKLQKVLEEYFLKFKENPDKENIESTIPLLILFQSTFQENFKKVIEVLRVNLGKEQKYILSIFGIDIGFDAFSFLKENHSNINTYFQLRYFLPENITDRDLQLLKEVSISEEGLIEFAKEYQWNEFISPTQIKVFKKEKDNEDLYKTRGCFLYDVKRFVDLFSIESISVKCIGENLFDKLYLSNTTSNIEYSVHQIRLWIYRYASDSRFDYFGFREAFKGLTSEEQLDFKRYSKPMMDEEVVDKEKEAIVPCLEFEVLPNENKLYQARIENIYFSSRKFYLLKEDNIPTEYRIDKMSNSKWNRIPPTNKFFRFIFPLEINKENQIVNNNPLQAFYQEIEFGAYDEIDLGDPVAGVPPDDNEDENRGYTEDANLKKEVHDFLKENQVEGIESKIIYEIKNYFRVEVDAKKEFDYTKEAVILYTLETEDGYAIIWENLELTDDRATFIFKSRRENYLIQIEIIKDAISSLLKLRSNLISISTNKGLQLFKQNLGYIASIRKGRGKEDAFISWKKNLEKNINRKIPPKLSDKEVEKVENWIYKNEDNSDFATPVDTPDIDTDKSGIFGGNTHGTSAPKEPPTRKNKRSILEALKRFNQ